MLWTWSRSRSIIICSPKEQNSPDFISCLTTSCSKFFHKPKSLSLSNRIWTKSSKTLMRLSSMDKARRPFWPCSAHKNKEFVLIEQSTRKARTSKTGWLKSRTKWKSQSDQFCSTRSKITQSDHDRTGFWSIPGNASSTAAKSTGHQRSNRT